MNFLKEYIPKFNTQFSVILRKKANLHRRVNKELEKNILQIFSIQNERRVNNDYTIMFKQITFN